MVATAGSTWKLAPSLVAFIDECDRRWPNRPTKSDGSIGDAGHAARASDHNPDDDDADRDPTRWVCAVDLTDASPAQPQPWHILDGIRARRDHRCKYGISEGLAFYSYDKPGRPAWTWVKYDGPNGHFSHGHLSIHNTAKARNDISSWLTGAPIAPTEEDDMPPAPAIAYVEGQRYVFVRGTNAKLYMIDPGGGQHDLGGVLTSGPDAVVNPGGFVDVAARGNDGATWLVTVDTKARKAAVPWRSLGGKS